jgi:hypothetical protein
MPHTLTIKKLVPWSEYNDYEGHLEGVLDSYDICGYLLMYSAEDWHKYEPEQIVEVELWLERTGSVTILNSSASPVLQQLEGVNYEVTGTVTDVTGETLLLNSVFPLRVDLDISSDMKSPLPLEISVGDQIHVVGALKVSLDLEEA